MTNHSSRTLHSLHSERDSPLLAAAHFFDVSLRRFYDAEAVMWAVGATALVSLALTVFAMQSKVRSRHTL